MSDPYRAGDRNRGESVWDVYYRDSDGDRPCVTMHDSGLWGRSAEDAARWLARALSATMPGCTCRVICDCGALVGTTPGCEGCAEHNVECSPPGPVIGLADVGDHDNPDWRLTVTTPGERTIIMPSYADAPEIAAEIESRS